MSVHGEPIRAEQLAADLETYDTDSSPVGVQRRFRHWGEIARWIRNQERRVASLEEEHRRQNEEIEALKAQLVR